MIEEDGVQKTCATDLALEWIGGGHDKIRNAIVTYGEDLDS